MIKTLGNISRTRLLSLLVRLAIFVSRGKPGLYIGGKSNPYLVRWYVVPRNPILNIYVHLILRDDDDRALHDHPWLSLSVILSGSYAEITKNEKYGLVQNEYFEGDVLFRNAKHAHRLVLPKRVPESGRMHFAGKFLHLLRRPAWTLFITGPKIRKWGFYCPQGWRHWKQFVNESDSGIAGKGCD